MFSCNAGGAVNKEPAGLFEIAAVFFPRVEDGRSTSDGILQFLHFVP
jgi:hypothetical protein